MNADTKLVACDLASLNEVEARVDRRTFALVAALAGRDGRGGLGEAGHGDDGGNVSGTSFCASEKL